MIVMVMIECVRATDVNQQQNWGTMRRVEGTEFATVELALQQAASKGRRVHALRVAYVWPQNKSRIFKNACYVPRVCGGDIPSIPELARVEAYLECALEGG